LIIAFLRHRTTAFLVRVNSARDLSSGEGREKNILAPMRPGFAILRRRRFPDSVPGTRADVRARTKRFTTIVIAMALTHASRKICGTKIK
jgi:hypothetical protein